MRFGKISIRVDFDRAWLYVMPLLAKQDRIQLIVSIQRITMATNNDDQIRRLLVLAL